MRLSNTPFRDGARREVQVQFSGLDHRFGQGDGTLWDMSNLTGDYAPLLATRKPRTVCGSVTAPGGLFAWEKLLWADGTSLYYDGEAETGLLTAGRKRFAALGSKVAILPDKVWFDAADGSTGGMEATYSDSVTVTLKDGTIYGEEATANTLQVTGVDWIDYFQPGDAVTISGMTIRPQNNKTAIVREVDGDELRFSDNCFDIEESPVVQYCILTVTRAVPELDYICQNENRMWGCSGDTIRASALGDLTNWERFDGVETDSWAVDTGSAGSFTACYSFLGYPVFFKEDRIFKVYGSTPSRFQVMGSAVLGVKAGCAGTLAVAGETLYYLSSAGVMAYTGGFPRCVSGALGDTKLVTGVGGSDGLKYYLSAKDTSNVWRLYVYDTRTGLWHIEDNREFVGFTMSEGSFYGLTADGSLVLMAGEGTAPAWATTSQETAFSWYAEFNDFTEGSPDKKWTGRVQIRAELDTGASLAVWYRHEQDAAWRQLAAVTAPAKRSVSIPVKPDRADHYRLKLTGTGGCKIYSLARVFSAGSYR